MCPIYPLSGKGRKQNILDRTGKHLAQKSSGLAIEGNGPPGPPGFFYSMIKKNSEERLGKRERKGKLKSRSKDQT